MFNINDFIVYGSTGVCQITDITKNDHDEPEYYVLRPVYDNKINNMVIKALINNSKVQIRKVVTKDQVSSLIASMPVKETIWIDDSRERSECFKALLKTGECEEWIKLVKTLYLEKELRSAEGKTLTHTDEDIMRTAEKRLCEEFAIALNLSPAEVLSYILEHVKH
ncbi:MAG: transcriptional regulator [Syntrophomonadaceae bacterium]|nr:transcriptional regulator [Syntrophomonadaceae bacterium]